MIISILHLSVVALFGLTTKIGASPANKRQDDPAGDECQQTSVLILYVDLIWRPFAKCGFEYL